MGRKMHLERENQKREGGGAKKEKKIEMGVCEKKKRKKPIFKSWLRPIRVRKKSLDPFFSQSSFLLLFSFIGAGN